MNLEFKFKDIVSVNGKDPVCRINLNGEDLFVGKVSEHIALEHNASNNNVLRVYFENKSGRDTVLDDNNAIVNDLTFELERLIIDGIDLKHLIWKSKYFYNESVIDSCLFFGPKGYWELVFDAPVLKWCLKTNHDDNQNDPTWEVDYNYYEEACRKLDKIQTR